VKRSPGRFDADPYPGRPKVLFVGPAFSSHCQSWIELLGAARLNVRFFSLPGLPPPGWKVRSYLTGVPPRRLDPACVRALYPAGRAGWAVRAVARQLLGKDLGHELAWLARIVRRWRPDVVHTFALNGPGLLWLRALEQRRIAAPPRWVLQLWGGSDVEAIRHDLRDRPEPARALRRCDSLLADNRPALDLARELGTPADRIPDFAPVPGTGGIDLEAARAAASEPPSARRLALMPKAYESRWSKALPVIEGIRQAWRDIQPCRIVMLAANDEVRSAVAALPGEIAERIEVHARISRDAALELMSRARVMLAPSLVDGTPNTMLEAMAAGALPVVSPLDAIRAAAGDGDGVLWARNLWPEEIAAALTKAMTDDGLVERCAEANRTRVRQLADRASIAPRVIALYERLAAGLPRSASAGAAAAP